MRKYLLPSALILAFGLAIAAAQTINRGVQLSQDPTGPIGFDINNNVYFPGHFLNTGAAPSLTFCGTTPAVTGSDFAGVITAGTGSPTSCVLTFKSAYVSVPWCIVGWQTNLASMTWTAATNGLTITQTATSSNKINYICSGVN